MRLPLAALALLASLAPSHGQGTLGQEKQILPMINASWVAFRDWDGKQLIYFTTVLAYHCGLSEVRYSLDSDALDQRFPLPACDRQRPNDIDPVANPPYIALPQGAAKEIVVQLVYSDGAVSNAYRYVPCQNAGDSTCSVASPVAAPAAIPPSRSDSLAPGQRAGDSNK